MKGFTPHEDWMKLPFMTQTPYCMGHTDRDLRGCTNDSASWILGNEQRAWKKYSLPSLEKTARSKLTSKKETMMQLMDNHAKYK